MRKLKTILQSRYLFKFISLIVFGISLGIVIFFPFQSKYQGDEKVITGLVTNYEIGEQKVSINLKAKEMILVNYYVETKEEMEWLVSCLELGQKVTVEGDLKEPTKNTIPNLFNYKRYLNYKKIFYIMNVRSLKIKSRNVSVFYEIKNSMLDRIDKIDNTGYLRTFILGDKSKLSKDVMEQYQKNGISHLFSVSGMHVSFLVGIVMFFLNKVTYSNRYKYCVTSCFLIFYLFLTGMSSSILRTTIMFLVFSINRCLNLKIRSFDLMLLVLTISFLINPFLLCDVGFQFSYWISMCLVLKRKTMKQIKGRIQQSFYLSCLCFIVSIPICLYQFGYFNIFSIILNLFMIPIISSIIFPMSFVVFCVPSLFFVYEKMINGLEWMNSFFSMVDVFQIFFIKPSIWVFVIYGIIVITVLISYKFLILLFGILLFHKMYPYIDRNFMINVLDVGQGDAIIIKIPFQRGNLLIDTGGIVGSQANQSSITDKKIIPYLNSLGITKLDYLILTHGDYDHMGEAINLVENFKIEKVIFNCGEFNELEQNLIKVLDEKKIKYYSCIKELNIDDNKLYFLNNKAYGNENDNSSVIYTKLNNNKFLFMGDASIEVEENLLEKYNLKDIDVLKVGHHGSKTSSSREFINEINPQYSIISVGKNNRYGHPSKEVLNNLENSKIYRTDRDGSVMFKINKNKLKIEICPP